MRRFAAVLSVGVVIAGCVASPPAIVPAPGVVSESDCRRVFPVGDWQLVHALWTELPGGRAGSFIGVVVIRQRPVELQCAVMTLEGLVLFEAAFDGNLDVRRSVPPFDSDALARGLVDDIRLMFLPPDGSADRVGVMENGAAVCRYGSEGTDRLDVALFADGHNEIRRFDAAGRIERTVELAPGAPFSGRMVLTADRPSAYRIVMAPISATPLPSPSELRP